jgi:hypothetical protein
MTTKPIIETTELECGLLRIDNAWACERCNGVFIGEHFSAARCNATGVGVTLCHDCCEVANAEAVKQSAADHPAQPIVVASDGVVRFKCNPIVRWLLDAGPFDMNTIALKPELAFRHVGRAERTRTPFLCESRTHGLATLPPDVVVDAVAFFLVRLVVPANSNLLVGRYSEPAEQTAKPTDPGHRAVVLSFLHGDSGSWAWSFHPKMMSAQQQSIDDSEGADGTRLPLAVELRTNEVHVAAMAEFNALSVRSIRVRDRSMLIPRNEYHAICHRLDHSCSVASQTMAPHTSA